MRLTRTLRFLTGEVPPLVYILMCINLLIGLFFLTGFSMGEYSSVLYNSGVLVERHLWGGLLAFTSCLGVIGLIKDRDSLVKFTGSVGFMLWLFASISLAQRGHWYVFSTIGLMHIMFHAYVSMAAGADVLRRRPASEVTLDQS